MEAGKKRGITLGIPIITLHSGTGEETRFDSVIAARRKLGIHNAVIDMSLKGETIKGNYIFSRTPEHLAEQPDLPREVWVKAVSSLGLIPKTEVSDRGRIQDSRGRRSYSTNEAGYKVFMATFDKS
jgi:hypothetical protein